MTRKRQPAPPPPVDCGLFDFSRDPREPGKLVIVGHLSDTDAPESVLDALKAHPTWQVVNAAHPLPGVLVWRGTFFHGVVYAAGDPNAPSEYGATLATRWCELDAWPVAPISDAQVRAWIDAQLVREGENPSDVSRLGGYTKLARFYDLPYAARDIRRHDAGHTALTCSVWQCGDAATCTEWTTGYPLAFYPLCETHAQLARRGERL